MLFSQLFQPRGRDINGVQHSLVWNGLKPCKGRGKRAVKFVEVPFIFDHCGAGQKIECLDIIGRQPCFHALQKRQKLAQADGDTVAAQIIEKRQEHCLEKDAVDDDQDEHADDAKQDREHRAPLQKIKKFSATRFGAVRPDQCAQ